MTYTVKTGCFETGTQEQQAIFTQIFGAENTQSKFDFYFHWYNIAHEYGHCLCNSYQSEIVGVRQEFLVNRFAVSLWRYAGYKRELERLQNMLCELLGNIENPVPAGMSYEAYFAQLWGTDRMMEVPVYGYFQFTSVLNALETQTELPDVLKEMGIHTEIVPAAFPYKEYQFSAGTAGEVLDDLRRLLDSLGIAQPETSVELTDNPAVQCMCVNGTDNAEN